MKINKIYQINLLQFGKLDTGFWSFSIILNIQNKIDESIAWRFLFEVKRSKLYILFILMDFLFLVQDLFPLSLLKLVQDVFPLSLLKLFSDIFPSVFLFLIFLKVRFYQGNGDRFVSIKCINGRCIKYWEQILKTILLRTNCIFLI